MFFFYSLFSLPNVQSTAKQEHKLSKTEGTTPGLGNTQQGQTDLSVKPPDNVKIKGLQANVSIPKVNGSNARKQTLSTDWRFGRVKETIPE